MKKHTEITNNHLEQHYKNSSPVLTLFRLFSKERRKVVLSLIFGAIKHTPFLFLPIIIGDVITSVSDPERYGTSGIIRGTVIIVILLIQNIPMHTLFVQYMSVAIRNVEAQLRNALVRRLQELSIAFHENYQSGRLQSKVLRDVESIEILARQIFLTVYHSLMTVIFAVVVTVLRDRLVALFFLICVPISVVMIHIFRKRISIRNEAFRTQIETMSAMVSEMVTMLPITRAHGVEEKEISKINTQLEKVKHRGIRLDIVNALFGATTWVAFQSFQFICLLVTGFMAYRGRIPVGDVVMYQTFFVQIINSITGIINIYPQLSRGFDSIRSMGEILECPDIEQNEGKQAVKSVRGDLQFEEVNYFYEGSDVAAVCDFNQTINSGECVAIVGESGSGKSTLINLIIGFRRPTSGKILLDGQDMQHLDLRTFRRFLAVVPQESVLFSGTIRENITYGLEDIPEQKLREILELSNVDEFISRMPEGLDTLIGEHGARLSGGQRQRIAIARALIRDPRIIILDEATSALDVASEKLVQQAISHLAKGRTMLIVAHRLSTIRKADRILVLKQGRCIESGTHEELCALDGEFQRFQNLQI
ncbi:ABC transporter ATP-binding protein [Chitinispirillales bacterium ANBcel5]|uniref:ABC transporter ATP-binding protein n=1 Tax=Cellulosispirillum alkaliphilum TaxID=3039283 RepID=UPI002A4FAD64|nr:ABC transporter ATP-binding protein [Chitinispirillales bacterium ANBcel5]